ncbi:hypothetical protein [Cryobacterium serini]|uniref:Uncharacterized protein n=1 Tax=Cryobacterium serini TaxID=1259201 RepID=A0A4R9BTM2_9MICO|nr:hypothetical protein [Cryobacterium serini]TFD90759.1 hypothetical protein E3T51_02145 [Cryobacterium serini]
MRTGEVGTIRVVVLANGQTQAHARMRDEFGTLHRLKGTRATEVEARRALDDQADLLRNGIAGLSLAANLAGRRHRRAVALPHPFVAARYSLSAGVRQPVHVA